MSTVCNYPTDVSDEQWDLLQLILPKPKWRPGGPGRKPLDLRRVVNGIFYVNKTGCQWHMMPMDVGNGHTIYGYFRRWRLQENRKYKATFSATACLLPAPPAAAARSQR